MDSTKPSIGQRIANHTLHQWRRFQATAIIKLDLAPEPVRYRWLRRHIGKKPGFFVEAGANDGLTRSNTIGLEQRAGWKGLLIEPIPTLADKCRASRPHCLVEQCALVPPGRADKPVKMTYANLMSLVEGAMKSPGGDAHHIELGIQCMAATGETAYELLVPGMTLSQVFDKHGVKEIDLLCLDVEGFELPALQGLDFSRHKPKWILVEARFEDEIHAHLQPHYDLRASVGDCDRLYSRRESE